MRKLSLILGIFFITFLVKGQENKLSFGLMGSYNNYSIDFNVPTGFTHKYETIIGYSYGLDVQYNLNEKLFLQSGLHYSKKGYRLVYHYNFVAIDPVISDPSIPQQSTFLLNYLNVPLMGGYYLKSSGKFRFSMAIGINNEILLHNSERTLFGGGVKKDSEVLSKNTPSFLSSAQFNASIEYHIGKKLFITLTPYYKYLFTSIKDDIISFHKPMYGGFISVNYKLFKQKEKK